MARLSNGTRKTADFVGLSTLATIAALLTGARPPLWMWLTLAAFYIALAALAADDWRHDTPN